MLSQIKLKSPWAFWIRNLEALSKLENIVLRFCVRNLNASSWTLEIIVRCAKNLLNSHKTCQVLYKSLKSLQNIKEYFSKLVMQTGLCRMSLYNHQTASAYGLGRGCIEFSRCSDSRAKELMACWKTSKSLHPSDILRWLSLCSTCENVLI